MSENIRLTYIPQSNVDEGFYQSIVEFTEGNECVEIPFILYNNELDINVENLDSIIDRYTEYIDKESLYKRIEEIVKEKSDDNVSLLIYGFNLSLDDIRNEIATRINDNVLVFISAIVNDDEHACSASISFPSSIADESDEEWNEHKKDLEDEMRRIEEVCNKLNKIFNKLTDGENVKPSKKKQSKQPIEIKSIEALEPIAYEPKKKEKEKIEDSELDDNFVCYTYEDTDNIVSVVRSGNIFSIEDDDNRVEFDKKALDFIIESLMKFYNK